MDENTIFKPIDTIRKETGIQPEIPPNENPVELPPPPELPSEPAPSLFSKIFKIFLGIGIILGIVLAVYNLILPKFFPTKINQVKLVYWGLFKDASIVVPIISDFEKEHPNIKIEYQKQNIEEYKDKLVTRSNNGNGPDIYGFHNTWVGQLSDLLLPLPESVITKDDFSKSYYPVARTDLIRNGAIYGIPMQIDTLSLYVNRDLFQAAGLSVPTSWDDFASFARQLTVKDATNGIKTAGAAMGTSNNITHAPDIISMLFVQDGVDLKNMPVNLSGVTDALKFYSSFALPASNVWDETLDESIKAFSGGTLAMYFGYFRDFFTIKSLNPNLQFDIYPVPALPGQNATIASYWVEGVSSKSRYQKEAASFLQYLTSKEVVQKLFAEEAKTRNFGEPYARVDLADSLKNSIVYPFVAQAPSAVSSFFVDGTFDKGINSQMNSLLNIAVDSILRGTSPEQASETLSSGVSQTLKQYGL